MYRLILAGMLACTFVAPGMAQGREPFMPELPAMAPVPTLMRTVDGYYAVPEVGPKPVLLVNSEGFYVVPETGPKVELNSAEEPCFKVEKVAADATGKDIFQMDVDGKSERVRVVFLKCDKG